MRTEKPNPFFRDLRQFEQGNHLKAVYHQSAADIDISIRIRLPSTIREDVKVPSLKLVRSADGVQNGLTGLQTQMISIVQT